MTYRTDRTKFNEFDEDIVTITEESVTTEEDEYMPSLMGPESDQGKQSAETAALGSWI
jgi:hypothetical protein